MAIEVMLMKDIPDVGSEGDVVRVAAGHARNYLFPRKLAAPVTEATRRRLAKMQAEREEQRKLQLGAAQRLAARLEGVSCTITVKSGAEGKLYGSVTGGDIAEALKAQGVEVDKHAFVLEAPIKELGVYDVPVKLHADIEAKVKVWVVEE